MDSYFFGMTAAVFVSFLWTLNSILFSEAGKRIGSATVNAFRIIVAVLLLGVTHIILFGTIIPAANQDQWLWMGISGIVGLGIGDFALFAAFVMIGPRRSLLLMALAPVCAALFAYLFLEEVLSLIAIVGIAITLTGIIVVLVEKGENDSNGLTNKRKKFGIALGIIGGVGQGVGLVISKYGMVSVADDPSIPLNSLSATLIRMIVASIFIWICVVAAGKIPHMLQSLKDRQGMKLTSGGAFIGPFLGVWLSMVAVTYVAAGIAQTLMSLMPVIIIPMVWVLFREKTNWRGIVGAAVAVVGVAILFMT
jgi:drug/metabolite transporter (DMT)-like permease